MFICAHTYTYIYVCVWIRIFHTSPFQVLSHISYIYTCKWAWCTLYMYTYSFACVDMYNMYVCIYTCVCVNICVCVDIYMCMCKYMCVCVDIYIYIYIYTHTHTRHGATSPYTWICIHIARLMCIHLHTFAAQERGRSQQGVCGRKGQESSVEKCVLCCV